MSNIVNANQEGPSGTICKLIIFFVERGVVFYCILHFLPVATSSNVLSLPAIVGTVVGVVLFLMCVIIIVTVVIVVLMVCINR